MLSHSIAYKFYDFLRLTLPMPYLIMALILTKYLVDVCEFVCEKIVYPATSRTITTY